jgi:hypothetical protein
MHTLVINAPTVKSRSSNFFKSPNSGSFFKLPIDNGFFRPNKGSAEKNNTVQLQPSSIAVKPTTPTFIADRPQVTDRIMDPHGMGSLSKSDWTKLVTSAKEAMAKGEKTEATRIYLILLADVAKVAQADRVYTKTGSINLAVGDSGDAIGVTAGLNFTLQTGNALASTGYVAPNGKLRDVGLNAPGQIQPEVATVVTRDIFTESKEFALGVLRHEMEHAEHLKTTAANKLARKPNKDTEPMPGSGDTEVLAAVEGFTTMYHLADPVPSTINHFSFTELNGALNTSKGAHWANASPTTRKEALGRLQEYYCHALKQKQRESFETWTSIKAADNKQGEQELSIKPIYEEEKSEQYRKILADRERTMYIMEQNGEFFSGLKAVFARHCKGFVTPLKLP